MIERSLTIALSLSFESALARIRKRSTRLLRGEESLTAANSLLEYSSNADGGIDVEMSFVKHTLM